MFPAQISTSKPDQFSRCEEHSQIMDHGASLSKIQKTDATIKESVERAIWNDDVLRAIEYSEIAVHAKNGVVYLNGHIVSTTSQGRIQNALRAIPGIQAIQNNLVLDDRLTNEVAAALGTLEHTYACKFFTGASHGLISLNGIVGNENIKLLAEKCVARNPNVRGVINHVHVSGTEPELQDQPFLQPIIGEIIYFLDGLSGIVKQVIINPNNRRVVAMIVLGPFADQQQGHGSFKNGQAPSPERLIVLSMDVVRYLTRVSGFLHINSNERERYMDFDSGFFRAPDVDWAPPYPYCPDDVLFPVEQPGREAQGLWQLPGTPVMVAPKEELLWEQLLANDDGLGG